MGHCMAPPTNKVVNDCLHEEILFTSSPCHSHCSTSDPYCLIVSIQLECPSDETAAGVPVPARAWMDKIIRLYLEPIIPDITQVIILNNTDFLVYKGH